MKKHLRMSSAAVVIGTLRVKESCVKQVYLNFLCIQSEKIKLKAVDRIIKLANI